MDQVVVTGIEFYAYHGVSDEEQVVGHRFIVDIEVGLDLRQAGLSDCIDDTVNYAALARCVVEAGSAAKHRLVESVAEAMAAGILARFPVQVVTVSLSKLAPPMHLIAASAGVRITRSRE